MIRGHRLLSGLFVFALTLITVFAAPGHTPAWGQDDPGLVIAVMDMQMILRESTAVQAIEEQLDRQRAAHQAALKKKEVEVRRADKELARQRAILSSEAFAQKRLELEQQVSALQQDIQRRKRQLDQLFGQGMREVQKVLIDVAQEIAAERGADLVLSKATVVLVRPELDISQEALERLNAALPTITLPAVQN